MNRRNGPRGNHGQNGYREHQGQNVYHGQHPPRRRRRRKPKNPAVMRMQRFLAMGFVFTACIVGLILQIWRLQVTYGDEYDRFVAIQEARRDIERVTEVFHPVRGGMVDRHQQPITGSEQVFYVILDVEALHNRHNRRQQINIDDNVRDYVIGRIADVLPIHRGELVDMFALDPETDELLLQRGRNHQILHRNVSAEIAIPLAEAIPEIRLQQSSNRWHHDPFFAPQVVGFMRGDSRWGLEQFYRRELDGTPGRRIRVQGEVETIPVRDGYTIITTLDGAIQRLAQEYVDRTLIRHPANFVGMIVMNPFTGEILAMAQAPTFSVESPFNPNYFTCPNLQESWGYLTYGERETQVMSLWRNFHTTRSNEPGSTFKPFVIAAAIEEGKISPNNMFHCRRYINIADQTLWCWNDAGCGTLSLRVALARSCNMAMVDINDALGVDLFYRYRGDFGFGERTGIDLPAEEAVSSRYVMYPRHRLGPVEMGTSSMGQVFNATTIQLINGYAALINGGNLMRPFLVSQIVDSRGVPVRETQPTVVRRAISEETSDFIRTEMRYVVSMRPNVGDFTGTGWRAYIPGHSVGGKTSTAQQGIRGGGEYNPSFISFFPVENPQFLILMTIDRIEDENYRFASTTVAPIMREFMLDLIRLKNIQPFGETDEVIPELDGVPMPDFSGERVTAAVTNIVNMGMGGYQVVGGGTVISHHWPMAGNPMPETTPVFLFTDPATRLSERMVPVPNVVGLTAETANFVLQEIGLPVVVFREQRVAPPPDDGNLQPHTGSPEQRAYGYMPATMPLPYVVHQQFPEPGSEIERGTQVIIRAR